MVRDKSTMSPCRRICKMDKSNEYAQAICKGCGRTRSEIQAWKIMSKDRKKLILSVLQERLRRVTHN